jgi:hypothetical protein
MIDDMSLIRVANTPETEFLMQAELMAIMQGLQYTEIEVPNENIYKGYVD